MRLWQRENQPGPAAPRAHMLRPPAPPRGVWAIAPLFQPLTASRHAAGSSLHQPGEPRTPVGSPVRAPRGSSAEVFSWHQRGGREGERPRRCRPRADSIRAGVRSKAHRFAVAGRTGCTGSRTVVVTVEHHGDEHLENRSGGGSRHRAPLVWLRSPRFLPLPFYADAAGSSLHQRGEPAPHG